MSAVTDALTARQQAQQPSEHWWSPIVDALMKPYTPEQQAQLASYRDPSWSDQASQYDAMQQQGAPLNDRMAAALGLLGGFGGSIRAYHGSPHVFDAFDAAKIGTGEGAQAYGHGLYFAENPKIAGSYKDKLTMGLAQNPRAEIYVNGKPVGQTLGDRAVSLLQASGGDLAKATETLKTDYNDIMATGYGLSQAGEKQFSDAFAQLKGLEGSTIEHKPYGALYEVNLAPDPEDLLHWDKPLSEQGDKVLGLATDHGLDAIEPALSKIREEAASLMSQAPNPHEAAPFLSQIDRGVRNESASDIEFALRNWGRDRDLPDHLQDKLWDLQDRISNVSSGDTFSGINGEQLYRNLTERLGSPQAASEALKNAGIPGIRYLDAGSRGAGEGSHNIVLFDPAQAQIVSRNGQPVTDALMARQP